MNSGPRWLISMTDMPLPCQSSISAAACASTSFGSTAGPAEKLWIGVTWCSLLFCRRLQLLDQGADFAPDDALANQHAFAHQLRRHGQHLGTDRTLVERRDLLDLGDAEVVGVDRHRGVEDLIDQPRIVEDRVDGLGG